MRFHWLPIAIACLPLISCGQSRTPATTSSYLPPSSNSLLSAPQFTNVASACSSDRVKSALSAPRMLSALQGVGSKKGEFETTEQFQSRVGAVAADALARNNLSADDVAITVNIPDFAIEYNADSKILKVGSKYTGLLSTSSIYNSSSTEKFTYYINAFEGYNDKAIGSYVGSNAFGVKKQIFKVKANSVGLIVPNLSSMGWPGGYGDQTVTLTGVSPDAAMGAKSNLAVLFVGALQAPYVETGVDNDSPTIQKPLETSTLQRAVRMIPRCTAIVNRKTGEVLRNL
jgi:hypothetical protein